MTQNNSVDRTLRHCIPLVLLMIAAGVLLSGCAGRGKSMTAAGGADASPEAALSLLALSCPTGAITATARIDINARGERHPVKAAMMMKKPAQFRLESIPLLGPPDFFLTVDDDDLRVFLPGKGTFYQGRATERNIARFFPLALPAAEMVSILMGQLPQNNETDLSLQGEREEGLYRIDEYRAARKLRSLWIDPAEGILVRIRRYTLMGGIAYTADFEGRSRAGDGFMPERMTFSGEGMSMVLRYTEILPLDDDAASFSLPVPEGIIPVPLD